MATNIGSIKYTLELDTSKFDASLANIKSKLSGLKTSFNTTDRAIGDTEKGIGGLSTSFGKLSGAFAVGQIAASAFTSVIGKLQSAVGGSFSALKDLEKSRASFEVLTGSAEIATSTIKDLAKFANSTPFEFPDLAKSAKTLLGFGISAQDVSKRIRQIGDISAATGGDLSGIATVVGQIFAAGKVNGQDYLQLINNSVALGPEIAKELGIPLTNVKKAIEDGAVTSDVFARALDKATTSGGKFFGGTEKLAGTLDGRISTLKDTFTGLVGSFLGVDFTTGLVEADGLFAKISDGVKKLSDGLSKLDFTKVGEVAIASFSKLSDFIYRNRDAILGAANGLKSFIVEVFNAGKAIFEYLAPKIGELIGIIVTQLLPVLSEFYNKYLKDISNFISAVLLVAIGLLIDSIKLFVTELAVAVRVLDVVIQAIKDFAINIYNGVISAFNAVVDFIRTIPEKISSVLSSLINIMQNIATNAWNAFKNASITVWNTIYTWITTIPILIVQGLGSLPDILLNAGIAIFTGLWNGMKQVWDTITGWLSGIAQKIKDLKGPLSSDAVLLVDEGSAIFNGLWDGMKQVWSKIEGWISGVASKVSSAFKNIVSTVGNIQNTASGANVVTKGLPKFASGVSNFSGGSALVGEAGPEIVNLPRGTQVIPADKTLSVLTKVASLLSKITYTSPLNQSAQDISGVDSSINSLSSAIKSASVSSNNTVQQKQVIIAAVPINGITLTKEQLRTFYRDLTTAYGEDIGAFV